MSLSWKGPWLAAIAAVIIVCAAVFWSLDRPSEQHPTAQPVAAPVSTGPAAPANAADTARLRQLEQQMEQLNRRLSAEEHARATPPPAPMPLTPEEQAQRREAGREMFEMKVDAWRQERVDPSWADPARHALANNMGTLLAGLPEDRRGQLLGVDCRSTTCLATLEFPNFAAAKDQFPRFVEHIYDVPCGRTVMLDDVEDPAAPFQVKVFFDECARN
ncbi:hypothetical protein ACLESD_25230 [Pyxidicoccus sp. 3LFB2]